MDVAGMLSTGAALFYTADGQVVALEGAACGTLTAEYGSSMWRVH